jgi:putative nucleotidyltransferase with HDIG domain
MAVQQVDGAIEQKVSRIVGGITNLPTPPIVFTQIQKVLGDPNTSAFNIASILQEDPAMSARVLKMTNSVYYGLTRTVESIKQAVIIIGMEAIRNLVLSASVFDMFKEEQIDQEFQDFFWRHSLATAFAARLMAHTLQEKQQFDPEAGFSAGLLHDIGKMVISLYMPEEAAKIKALVAQNPERTERSCELEILGFDHTLIGAELAKRWALPAKLQDAIRYHHDLSVEIAADQPLIFLINLADYLAYYTFEVEEDEEPKEAPATEAMAAVGKSKGDLHGLAPSLREEYLKAETFLEMAKGVA